MLDTSDIILKNLNTNENFARKVFPFLKKDYFETNEQKVYFDVVSTYFTKYNTVPTKQAVDIEFSNQKIKQDELDNLLKMSEDYNLGVYAAEDPQWLLDTTEQFCQDRSLYLAIAEAISIAEGSDKNLSKTAIPDILAKALSVSFDTNIGHNYIEDAQARYEFYQKKENKVPMFLDKFNQVTNGGIPRKTLNAVVAETGGGKSIFLTNLAANYIQTGETVLYISMEMEEIGGIAKRIDANLMDVKISDVDKMAETKWQSKVADLKKKAKNSLVIKEYPTSSAHVGHFRHLLHELKQKKNFIPTIIIIDYLNICASAKHKQKSNMYEYIKSISEELRALAVETNTILWTALQFNTEGTGNTDPDITNVGESRGINHTLDFLFALVHSEEMAQMGQVMVKQLKSRYGDKDRDKKFVIGLDKEKMRFYNITGTNSIITPKSSPQPTTTTQAPKQNKATDAIMKEFK